ncbi:MAG TPA: guanylate kinase, partial [Elusimicrobiota bacterium]|nr:guanylate kinase [Elusimicrobiota bacterium]
GKSTLCQALLKERADLVYSVSATTRPARVSEVNGKDYFFVTVDQFKKKIDEGEFLEWALVHDHYYGTPRSFIDDQLARGADILLDVDPQGALAIQDKYPQCVSIFVYPPNWESLERRLRTRGQDDEETIHKRLSNARHELTYLQHYNYLVVNNDIREAMNDFLAIIRAEHHRVCRYSEKFLCLTK